MISGTMIGRCVPAGVLPLAMTLATSPAYFSGWCSLYFSSKLRGFFPVYRGRRGGLEESSFTGGCNSSREMGDKRGVYLARWRFVRAGLRGVLLVCASQASVIGRTEIHHRDTEARRRVGQAFPPVSSTSWKANQSGRQDEQDEQDEIIASRQSCSSRPILSLFFFSVSPCPPW